MTGDDLARVLVASSRLRANVAREILTSSAVVLAEALRFDPAGLVAPTGPDDIEAVVARSGRLCDELEARAECRSEISKTLRALDVDWTTFLELLAEPGPTAGPLAARKGHSRSKAGLRAGGKPPRP